MKWFSFTLIAIAMGCLGLLAFPTFSAGSYLDGEEAYLNQDFEVALQYWEPLARQGNAEAQNMLGYMYRHGQGLPQDYKKARQWYRLAADQGNARAQNNLGVMYRLGLGGAQDYHEAFLWFQRAAEQGNGGGQSHLGLMYYKGEGVPKDNVKAYMWATLSAEQDIEQATQALIVLEQEMSAEEISEAKEAAKKWKPRGEETML